MTQDTFPIRPEVLAFESYTPGLSIEEIRERYGLSSIIKMASNENPLGVSPVVQAAVQKAAAFGFRYIQSGNPRLIKAIAEHHNIAQETVVAGNGSDEIIDLLLRVCPTPGVHNIVINKPAFSMYKICAKLCGVEFREVSLKEDFSFDWDGLLNSVDGNTALVFITTPDNPSGYCPDASEVEAFLNRLPKTCLLVIDEAYMDFSDDEAGHSLLPRVEQLENVVFLRTFSKSFGLAGIRLGYGIMPPSLADAMHRVHPPFSVNILAEEAGVTALSDKTFYAEVLKTVKQGRGALASGLKALGCEVLPTQANFLMMKPGKNSTKDSKQVYEELLARGVIVRYLKSYGLPDYIRVSVGSAKENEIFLEQLKEVLG